MKYWEIIADKLSALGLSWGCSSETDSNGRVVLAVDKLTAFLELERQVLTQAENDLPRQWEIIADNPQQIRLEFGLGLSQ